MDDKPRTQRFLKVVLVAGKGVTRPISIQNWGFPGPADVDKVCFEPDKRKHHPLDCVPGLFRKCYNHKSITGDLQNPHSAMFQ